MIKLAFLNSKNVIYRYGCRKNHSTNFWLSFLNGNILNDFDSASVISQKGESQNGCYKATKHTKFSEKKKKKLFPTSDMQTYVCVSGDKK